MRPTYAWHRSLRRTRLAERLPVRASILRCLLATDDAYASWSRVDLSVPASARVKLAVDQRWFGTRARRTSMCSSGLSPRGSAPTRRAQRGALTCRRRSLSHAQPSIACAQLSLRLGKLARAAAHGRVQPDDTDRDARLARRGKPLWGDWPHQLVAPEPRERRAGRIPVKYPRGRRTHLRSGFLRGSPGWAPSGGTQGCCGRRGARHACPRIDSQDRPGLTQRMAAAGWVRKWLQERRQQLAHLDEVDRTFLGLEALVPPPGFEPPLAFLVGFGAEAKA